MDKRHKILILGFIIRVIFSFIAYHPFDLPALFIASLDVVKGINPFENIRYAYPPLYLYLITIILYPYLTFLKTKNINLLTFENSPDDLKFLFRISPIYPNHIISFLIELPNIIFSTACIWLIYEIVLFYKGDKNNAYKASLFWAINPTIIFLNVMWGLPDPTTIFFILLGLYYIQVKEKYIYGSISLSIAFTTKLYPIVFFISTIIFIYIKKNNFITIIKMILMYISFFLLVSIPTIYQRSLIFFSELGYQAVKRLGTLNVFMLFNYPPVSYYSSNLSPFIHWFFSIFGCIIGLLWLIRLYKNKKNYYYLYTFLVTGIIYYFLITWFTSPHSLMFFAFLIIYGYSTNNRYIAKLIKFILYIMSISVLVHIILDSNLFTMFLTPSLYIFGTYIKYIIVVANQFNYIQYYTTIRQIMLLTFSLIFNSIMFIISFLFIKGGFINE